MGERKELRCRHTEDGTPPVVRARRLSFGVAGAVERIEREEHLEAHVGPDAFGVCVVAARLLRRAANDAREHVPLSRAIAETSG